MPLLRAFAVAVAIATLAVIPSSRGPRAQETRATPWVEVHASRVRLIAGRSTSAIAAPYLAGLEIVMAEGWKTYWRMPGDSGVPPSFDWTGSANLASATVLYPAPIRMPEAGGEAIGYKGSVILPITVQPKNPAQPLKLKLALEFGLCREICIPATAVLVLDLAAAGAPPHRLVAALDRIPRPEASRHRTDPKLERVAVQRDGANPRLVIEAAFKGSIDSADVFVEAPESIFVPLPKRLMRSGNGTVRFESELSPALVEDLKGKTLTLTLVDDVGASEARRTLP
jgi:DsbC/DsbD-like thiol-disulfide interchange protein